MAIVAGIVELLLHEASVAVARENKDDMAQVGEDVSGSGSSTRLVIVTVVAVVVGWDRQPVMALAKENKKKHVKPMRSTAT